jgi:hypothetical protein
MPIVSINIVLTIDIVLEIMTLLDNIHYFSFGMLLEWGNGLGEYLSMPKTSVKYL